MSIRGKRLPGLSQETASEPAFAAELPARAVSGPQNRNGAADLAARFAASAASIDELLALLPPEPEHASHQEYLYTFSVREEHQVWQSLALQRAQLEIDRRCHH